MAARRPGGNGLRCQIAGTARSYGHITRMPGGISSFFSQNEYGS